MNRRQQEVMQTLERLLHAIYCQDTDTYRELVADDVSSFEAETPARIDSVEFHLHYMRQQKTVRPPNVQYRLDIVNPRVQLYGNVAIATYTLVVTRSDEGGIRFQTTNETRVFVREDNRWMMVHFHKTPVSQFSP
jgi:ketosteroid isomerase-like protein